MPRELVTPEPVPDFARFAEVDERDLGAPSPWETVELEALGPGATVARRTTFRLGRMAAHAALRALGRDDGPVLIAPGRDPVWPVGVVGSIAHTGDRAVALVAESTHSDGIGIDIEVARDATDLFEHVAQPDERVWIERLPQRERGRALVALFSAKEAIFKALFPTVGRLFDFDAVSLGPTAEGFAGRIVADLHPRFPPGRNVTVVSRWHGERVVAWLILPASGSAGDAC